MDNFNVPRKVNRHVLKALNELSLTNDELLPLDAITNQVKFQMRNLMPVANVDHIIRKSLYNLTYFGLITSNKMGMFGLRRPLDEVDVGDGESTTTATSAGALNTTPSPKNDPKKPLGTEGNPLHSYFHEPMEKKSHNHLDPTTRQVIDSTETLTGDDFDQVRKRMRTNNKNIVKSGRMVDLPHARQYLKTSVDNLRKKLSRRMNETRSNCNLNKNLSESCTGNNLLLLCEPCRSKIRIADQKNAANDEASANDYNLFNRPWRSTVGQKNHVILLSPVNVEDRRKSNERKQQTATAADNEDSQKAMSNEYNLFNRPFSNNNNNNINKNDVNNSGVQARAVAEQQTLANDICDERTIFAMAHLTENDTKTDSVMCIVSPIEDQSDKTQNKDDVEECGKDVTDESTSEVDNTAEPTSCNSNELKQSTGPPFYII